MTGTMPENPDAAIAGKIRMDGTAYYDGKTALAARARRDDNDRPATSTSDEQVRSLVYRQR